jgi:predicted ATP-grasp superfamily ATP-dependent carboligase
MVFRQGNLRGKTSYRQIREYPAFSGQATCRISISNKVAEDYLQKLLEHLDWHGVCQVDFVVEALTGRPYLIDINPRFWGSLVQGIASGVDFPHMVCEIAANGDVQPVNDFKEGVQTRWLGGELRGFLQHLTSTGKKGAFLRDFFRPVTSIECFDDFSLADPLPFAAWGWDSLYRLVKFRGNKPHESLEGIWQ